MAGRRRHRLLSVPEGGHLRPSGREAEEGPRQGGDQRLAIRTSCQFVRRYQRQGDNPGPGQHDDASCQND